MMRHSRFHGGGVKTVCGSGCVPSVTMMSFMEGPGLAVIFAR
jgi:hypothetical protein